MSKVIDNALDEFEDKMRTDTVGDEAHKNLFALAADLEKKDPVKYAKIIKRCCDGHYHDFATKVATPKMAMHMDLLEVGLTDIDQRMQNGEFDS